LLRLLREGFKDVDPVELEVLKTDLLKWQHRLTELTILEGVDDPKQAELAALVSDLNEAFSLGAREKERRRQIRRLADRGPGHIRNLAHQIEKIMRALDRLEAAAWGVDQTIADRIVPGIRRARQEVGGLDLIGLDATVAAYAERMRAWRESAVDDGFPFKKGAAIQLTRYFTDVCLLGQQDAYVRTGHIGNAFWAWDLKIGEDDYNQPDCPAVRALVTRPTKPAS
jgi:hypothetical protein